MKRSEAVKIIANLIYEYKINEEQANDKADDILQALENEGMKPLPISDPEYEEYPLDLFFWEEDEILATWDD